MPNYGEKRDYSKIDIYVDCKYVASTKALDDAGAFFAFSTKQFDEKKKDGIQYASAGAGLICPTDNLATLRTALDNAVSAGIAADLAENGKTGVIHRELGNHEFSYTHDMTDTSRALGGYGITDEEIQAETAAFLKAHYEWEAKQELAATVPA